MIGITFTPGVGSGSHYARCLECFAFRELHNRPGKITHASCSCGGKVEWWDGWEVVRP